MQLLYIIGMIGGIVFNCSLLAFILGLVGIIGMPDRRFIATLGGLVVGMGLMAMPYLAV